VSFEFSSPLHVFEGKGTWYYVTLPKTLADELKTKAKGTRGGWGSLKVTAEIGTSQWLTSLFPHKKEQSFLLLVKADVRKKQNLTLNDMVHVRLNFQNALPLEEKEESLSIDEESFAKIKTWIKA
jgi:Domain of unknown function (DUF1905)